MRLTGTRRSVEAMTARSRQRIDALLVLAIAGLGVGDAAEAANGDAWRLAIGLVLGVAMAAVLVARRRAPAGVVCAELVLAAVWVTALYGWEQGPFGAFVALLIAVFALGLHAPRASRSGIALAAALGAVAVAVVRDAYGAVRGLEALGDVVPFWLWVAVAFAGGVALRRRERLAALFEDRAVRAERERELRAREAIVDERGRIARELHDVVAHNVSVMVVQAQGAARVLEADEPRVREALRAIETTGREAIDEMRRLLGVLRRGDEEPALGPRPGLAQLDALADSVRAAGVPVDVAIEGRPVALPAGVDVSAYRIVQEALTNTLKHAGAAHAGVVVRYAPGAVELEVHDDGAGAGARNGAGTGHGLVGMRERVALFGGELHAGAAERGGWCVRARLPVDREATR